MERRKFLTRSALSATAASTLAVPAVAQSSRPDIRWRLNTSQSLALILA
ncbi:MAG: twin-arginine translocation signal domain-containing protein [Limnohabitans sp.]